MRQERVVVLVEQHRRRGHRHFHFHHVLLVIEPEHDDLLGVGDAGANFASLSAMMAFFGAAWITLSRPSECLPAMTSSVFAGTAILSCFPAAATSRMRSPSLTPSPERRLQ